MKLGPQRVRRFTVICRAMLVSLLLFSNTRAIADDRSNPNPPEPEILEVGSLYGKGGPENIYQLRVAESGHVPPLVFWRQHSRQERSFTREVGSSHIQDLWTRTVTQSTDTGAAVIVEKEPNGVEGQALEVSVPVVLEGEIDHESDVDTFRFKTTRGQKLAFEIETPQSAPPAFNPRVDVFDSKGVEFLTNLKRAPEFKNATTPHLISVEPKVVATFEQEGEYYLKVRDVTNRNAGPTFRYRILIRAQIPHIGDIVAETRTRGAEDGKLDPWRVNLRAGEAKKVNIYVDHEEGFYHPANVISIQIEGLPSGVSALTGSSSFATDSRIAGRSVVKEERYFPKSQNVTIVLDAKVDAPATRMPVLTRVTARPYVNGKPGPFFLIGELPVMVLNSEVQNFDGLPKAP